MDKVVEQSKVIGLAVPAKPHIFQSDEELTKLFAECADEDRELANFGMSKYARLLNGEDRRR
ncbi:MAG TPA: hypothetical protein VJX67_05220 [Blastocatellia bacterium]|nr:hypothetical protein [Blastocatellia bacterium]